MKKEEILTNISGSGVIPLFNLWACTNQINIDYICSYKEYPYYTLELKHYMFLNYLKTSDNLDKEKAEEFFKNIKIDFRKNVTYKNNKEVNVYQNQTFLEYLETVVSSRYSNINQNNIYIFLKYYIKNENLENLSNKDFVLLLSTIKTVRFDNRANEHNLINKVFEKRIPDLNTMVVYEEQAVPFFVVLLSLGNFKKLKEYKNIIDPDLVEKYFDFILKSQTKLLRKSNEVNIIEDILEIFPCSENNKDLLLKNFNDGFFANERFNDIISFLELLKNKYNYSEEKAQSAVFCSLWKKKSHVLMNKMLSSPNFSVDTIFLYKENNEYLTMKEIFKDLKFFYSKKSKSEEKNLTALENFLNKYKNELIKNENFIFSLFCSKYANGKYPKRETLRIMEIFEDVYYGFDKSNPDFLEKITSFSLKNNFLLPEFDDFKDLENKKLYPYMKEEDLQLSLKEIYFYKEKAQRLMYMITYKNMIPSDEVVEHIKKLNYQEQDKNLAVWLEKYDLNKSINQIVEKNDSIKNSPKYKI